MPRRKTSAARQTVLYAENDALLREAVGDFLEDKGYGVYLAKDGLEALETARRVRPD